MRVAEVEREPTQVMCAAARGTARDVPGAARRAFAALEANVPPRGRRIYGYWDPPAGEYRACYELQDGDVPEEHGFSQTTLAGGRYRRARLQGGNVYAQIPRAFDALAEMGGHSEDGRPWLEHYRRHDEVDVFVPIGGSTEA